MDGCDLSRSQANAVVSGLSRSQANAAASVGRVCSAEGCTVVLCGVVRPGTTGLCRSHAQRRVQAQRQAALYQSDEWLRRVSACAACGKELPRKAWRKGDRCRVCTLKSDERRALMQRISTEHYADPANRERARQQMLACSEERLRAMLPWCPPAYRDLYRHLTRRKGMLSADARAVVEQAMADDAKAAERPGCPLLLFARVREARRWLREREAGLSGLSRSQANAAVSGLSRPQGGAA